MNSSCQQQYFIIYETSSKQISYFIMIIQRFSFFLLGAIFFPNRNTRPDGRNPNLFWSKFMVYITVFYHNNSAQMIKDGSKNIVQRFQTSDWRHLIHIILSQTIFKEKKFRKTHINHINQKSYTHAWFKKKEQWKIL